MSENGLYHYHDRVVLKKIICRLKCIVVCSLMFLHVGCKAADYSDVELKRAGEKLAEAPDEPPQKELEKDKAELEEGKEETEKKDRLEKDDLEVNGLKEEAEQVANEDKQNRMQPVGNTFENDGKYSSFLRKAWIVDGPKKESGSFEFIITGINAGIDKD